MGSVDRADVRMFKANFTSEGAEKLRNTVKAKLKEFMGDYTDDTLVEYVVVLLRNGRNKEEARNELDVFLADDSDSFVSWLWDHLATSLYLYIQAKEPDVDEAMPILELDGRNDSQNIDADPEREMSSNLLRSQHNREQKGLVGDAAAEPPPILRSEVEDINVEERRNRQAKRSASPRGPVQKKRTRADERPQLKRELGYKAVDAPRRLLQFAMRDAVGTSISDSPTDSALKRLRSVVSTSARDTPQVDRPQRIRSMPRIPNSMATVIKAVAEAAEDVRRTKPLRSVFDRLGCGAEVVEPEFSEHRAAAVDDEDYVEMNHISEEPQPIYGEQLSHGDPTLMEREPGMASDYPYEMEQYGEANVRTQSIVSKISAIAGDSHVMQHNLVNNSGEGMEPEWNKDQDELPVAANASGRIVNIHGNVSTWKSTSQFRAQNEVPAPLGQKSLKRSTVAATKLDAQDVKENAYPASVANGNGKLAVESQKLQSSSGLSIHSTEDTELRTIFVHTAATKGSVSQHFSKHGEVVKAVINTDATTGQPVGSAVIEFVRKEAADSALSLDGTYFMSRVIKVVKQSCGLQKSASAATATPRPHGGAVQGSSPGTPFAWYPHRSPFARGGGGANRGGGRSPMRGGPRSLQWKRDSSEAATSTNSTPPPFPARRFTYVRLESKPNAQLN